MKIKKIWFDGEWLYGQSDDGKVYRQSLLWYSRLLKASKQERTKYIISTIGIHWPELDEDVSFESFLYEDAEPTPLQHFFLTHPEINVSGFANKYGFNASLLRSYINGFKTPSQEREQEIMSCVEKLGKEYISIAS
ncbi:MAG: DUF2442 domain-containing protein [Bacteroidales bacterium]|nr:DUF2442 domain-containing protein [Bacteroidales bacterium]